MRARDECVGELGCDLQGVKCNLDGTDCELYGSAVAGGSDVEVLDCGSLGVGMYLAYAIDVEGVASELSAQALWVYAEGPPQSVLVPRNSNVVHPVAVPEPGGLDLVVGLIVLACLARWRRR